MLRSRSWPGRRNKQNICAVFQRESARDLGKSKIVTDAQSEVEPGNRQAHELLPRRVASAFGIRRLHEEMCFAVARHDLSVAIDEDLRIINALALAFGNPGD